MNFDHTRRPQNFANTYLKIANIATDREAEDERIMVSAADFISE